MFHEANVKCLDATPSDPLLGEFWGIAPTGKKIEFETVDVMRVRNGKISDHWGVANLFSLAQQLGLIPALRKR
jgi:predicted ester cyclase